MRFGCCAGPEMGQALARAGYDYLELTVARHLQPEVDEAGWAPLRRAIQAQPLPVEAFNILLPADLKVTGPAVDPERLGRYLGVAFQRAQALGGQAIVFGSGGARAIPEGFPRDRAWSQIVGFLQRAGDLAARRGITLCIEPLNRGESNVVHSLAEAVELAQDVGHPQVKALVDLYHLFLEAEPMDHIVAAGGWVQHVHVADTDRRAPGQGTYPYPAFVAALRQIGYDGRCSVECLWQDLAAECGPALAFLRRTWEAAAL